MTKKCSTLFCVLFAVISIAMAQPATMTKGQVDNSTQVDTDLTCQGVRDSLEVLILTNPNCDPPEEYHFPNDSSLLCPLGWMCFKTNYFYPYWHTWECSLGQDDYSIYGPHNSNFFILLNTSCYIKVTVSDDDGNIIGTDSIYFNIKDFPLPDDFEMEIVEVNDELNAKFSFMPVPDPWFIKEWISQDSINISPYGAGWIYLGEEPLYPETYYEYTCHGYNYDESTAWNLLVYMVDTCMDEHYFVLPGMYLNTENSNDNHFLKFKTSLQSGNHDEYVYTIFTVDSNGIRYPFIVNGGQVILPSSTTSYQIPAVHEHPYYQCAVATITGDGSYKILSYSNKVTNPWIDTTDIGEYDESDFQIYPNPAKDRITVEGTGNLSITSALGQTILTQVIDGQTTIELPQGLYFARMGNVVRKIVVE